MKKRNKGEERPKEQNCRYCNGPNWNPNIIKAQPENQFVIPAKKVTSRNIADSNTENNRKLKKIEITEPDKTERNDTDKSINKIKGNKTRNRPKKSYYHDSKN